MSRLEVNLVLIVFIISLIVWDGIKLGGYKPEDNVLYDPPTSFQCVIPQVIKVNGRTECAGYVNVDGWSITHLILFFFLGLVAPGYYLAVGLGSVAFEGFEYATGSRARWIIDPVTNLLGYIIGSWASKYLTFTSGLGDPVLTNALLAILVVALALTSLLAPTKKK